MQWMTMNEQSTYNGHTYQEKDSGNINLDIPKCDLRDEKQMKVILVMLQITCLL